MRPKPSNNDFFEEKIINHAGCKCTNFECTCITVFNKSLISPNGFILNQRIPFEIHLDVISTKCM